MRFVREGLFVVLGFALALAARAQSTTPVVSQGVPAQALVPGGAAVTIDLRNHFAVPGVTGTQIVQYDTVLGRFNVELLSSAAPRHVQNFLAYVQNGSFSNTFIHRAAQLETGQSVSIVQGGGYRFNGTSADTVAKLAPINLEYNLPNARGTLAAARTSDVNSATSEWYFNTRDNSTILGPSNGGGYSVFGRVLGNGMTVVDAIAAVQRFNAGGAFTEIPLRNYSSGTITSAHLVMVNSISTASVFPVGSGASIITFTLNNTAPGVVETTLSGSTLTLTALAGGTADVTVRAADSNGSQVETTFTVTVTASAPVFTVQPVSQTVAAGSTVVFSSRATSAGTYRWQRNGVDVEGANNATLVINATTAGAAGTYTSIATSSAGSVTSNPATLTVVNANALDVGRLINLSILTPAGSGGRALTVGAVVGPLTSGETLPLLFRAVGPGLAQPPFNFSGVLTDPQMTITPQGTQTALATNDNWGGGAELTAAFQAVGAFGLQANSLDSAIVRQAPGVNPGGYSVQVTGKGDATGTVLAEIYDASGTGRTANTPRLINVSVLKTLDPGATLTAGFVVRGTTARTVLVRAIGPGLSGFGIGDGMSDPQLTLFGAGSVRLAENDNWGGEIYLASAGSSVGAFAITNPNSKDAMLLATLAPGDYSAEVKGVGGLGGSVIVEVYEVP